ETKTALAHLCIHLSQQHGGISTAILRIGIRKEMADITERQCTEQRIRQCVQQYIAIRMRQQAATVRNAHAAEHHMVAVGEGMHVKATAYANCHASPSSSCCAR